MVFWGPDPVQAIEDLSHRAAQTPQSRWVTEPSSEGKPRTSRRAVMGPEAGFGQQQEKAKNRKFSARWFFVC